ncbi:sigma 54-interacting transcriptional regulator [Geobacter hydrogenophilus]|uniref:Sigma-54-dependent Fis family transcriptional regulator n=1 Tax=Geobacter hydrogenophilus TaxID=40983 RepID=A0A9W6LDU5_9BACT|nr:sigma-54-dependent Fis family transcriptional regulator [Geobacter hydrogenophilus]MBT0894513.1 sigma 54-interacting transcriptional regulator [Geobacter hydrogenophilus]GLI39330.1 sigma-54-dependent Fis family transcriptional regulator [Geobacter hydrogenophilus]
MYKFNGKIKPVRETCDDDLRSRLKFCAETGQIWLHEHRMLLVHAEVQASLRRELIDTLGMERARGLLSRMGYAAGMRDFELARTRAGGDGDVEAFIAGPQLHMLEGVAKVSTVSLEYDRSTGSFYGEFLWENSWESEWHKKYYGTYSEPVCWSQIGYACAYASSFMGRPILYKEIECAGMGEGHCRIVGKPLEDWDDASEYTRFFVKESIAEQLIDLQTQVVQLRSVIGEKEKLPSDIVGNSRAFRASYDMLQQAAKSQITVLLLGETGAGKEVFARALHSRSSRRNESFIAINCAAIPHDLVESELFGVEKGAYTGALSARPGRFERANGGTLFLDEIGDLPLSAQAKLLRVLQEGEIERLGDHKVRKVDVRLVAATNIDLKQLVKEGKFRSDLYYRLNAFQINIPPLRERKEDIPLLARRFIEKFSAIHGKKLNGFTDKAMRAILAYPWPGNIRELLNMVERGVILAPNGTRIELEQMFSAGVHDPIPEFGLDSSGGLGMGTQEPVMDLYALVANGSMTLDGVEASLIESAVKAANGNLSAAARALGLTRPQLAYRLKRLQDTSPAGSYADPAHPPE